jgi:hypothetical protein
MTKKDYELIARTLNGEKPGAEPEDYCDWSPEQWHAHDAMWRQWRTVCCRFADVLAADNPRFDRARFLAACGVNN